MSSPESDNEDLNDTHLPPPTSQLFFPDSDSKSHSNKDSNEDSNDGDDSDEWEGFYSSTSSSTSNNDNMDSLSVEILKLKLVSARQKLVDVRWGKKKYKVKYLNAKDTMCSVEEGKLNAKKKQREDGNLCSIAVGSCIVMLLALLEAAKVQKEKNQAMKDKQDEYQQWKDNDAALIRVNHLNIGQGNMNFAEPQALDKIKLQPL
ncbi:hypothetical protein GYMLUDRAFT_240364 [Collybiopsis luxurians FD-317 M1]|nr:hypothetical protein GYMLUDRAFT_240364 [Collybiopsis luxurians FD-317 M1]